MKRRNFIGNALKLAGGAALGVSLLNHSASARKVSLGIETEEGLAESSRSFGEKVLFVEKNYTDYPFSYEGALDKLYDIRKAFHRKFNPKDESANLFTIYEILQGKPFSFSFNPKGKTVDLLAQGFNEGILDCDTAGFIYLDLADMEGMPLSAAKSVSKNGTHFYLIWPDSPVNEFLFHPNMGVFGEISGNYNSPTKEEKALGIYNRKLSRKETLGGVYFNAGIRCCEKEAPPEKQAMLFGKAVKLDDRNLPAYYFLSHALCDMGRYGEAIEMAEKAATSGREAYVSWLGYLKEYKSQPSK
ncbi:MAG: hypothetical protein V1648_02605 [Candidatus Aenigmatarchaeota archaeon]